jgi:hypothetical protein
MHSRQQMEIRRLYTVVDAAPAKHNSTLFNVPSMYSILPLKAEGKGGYH